MSMKHKISELTGNLLDQAVALAEGFALVSQRQIYAACPVRKVLANKSTHPSMDAVIYHPSEKTDEEGWHNQEYTPSTNWAQGGPIKEENRVGTYWIEEENQWRAGISMHDYTPEFNISQQHGPTELVAAMRTFVRRKFGEEVELDLTAGEPEHIQISDIPEPRRTLFLEGLKGAQMPVVEGRGPCAYWADWVKFSRGGEG